MTATIRKSLNVLRKARARGDADRLTTNLNPGISPHPASVGGGSPQDRSRTSFAVLTPKETAAWLRVSQSFLARARTRGHGPPFIAIGRAIRYSESAVIQWVQSKYRLSTESKERASS